MPNNGIKVIFLDIDGVLNGYTLMANILWRMAKYSNMVHAICRKYDLFGIHAHKVYLLSRIVKKTGAKIVLSSSWRHMWYIPYNDCGRRMKALKDNFAKFDIDVIGTTPTIPFEENSSHRELEIRHWLYTASVRGYSIDQYVILDDEDFDLQGFVGNHLVKTDMGNAHHLLNGGVGLTRRHVKEVVNILNQ